MYGIGGINAVNPFSEATERNEVLIYSEFVSNLQMDVHLTAEQGTVYDSAGEMCSVHWTEYLHIYGFQWLLTILE